MSQKEKDFQSKPRSGGQKFGGKGRSRSFGEGSERGGRDRPARAPSRPFDRDSRPPRRDHDSAGADRPHGKPFEKREFGNRDSRPPRDRDAGARPYKKREFGGGDSRPPRDRDAGDRPYKKREFGGGDSRPPRDRDAGDRPYKKREFGGGDSRPPRDRDAGDRPYKKREFSDRDSRPPRDSDAGARPYKKREFGGSSEPRRDYKPEGRRDFGNKKPFNKDKRFDNRPQKPYARYGEEAPRREFREERAPAGADARQRLKSDRPSYGSPSPAYLYGVHAVTQALLNPERKHRRLLCTQKSYEELQEAWSEAAADGITLPEVITVEKEDIERLLPRDAVHQDLLLDCQPLEESSLHEYLLTAPDDAKVLVLDQVTDPHNVGAILRSAAAFGAGAVVVQTLHAPEITGVLAKSASGALEHVPLLREVNLSRALEQLKKAGFFCIGLDEEGKQTIAQLNLTGKTALVLGAEGSGLRRLVAENCDELVKLPTQGAIGSLNVSNAAAVALYELVRK